MFLLSLRVINQFLNRIIVVNIFLLLFDPYSVSKYVFVFLVFLSSILENFHFYMLFLFRQNGMFLFFVLWLDLFSHILTSNQNHYHV